MIIAVDGGATKTELLMFDPSNGTGELFRGGGCNPNVYGEEGFARLSKLFRRVKPHAPRVAHCVIGMAGAQGKNHRESLEAMAAAAFPNARLTLLSDAMLAHRALWGTGPGVTLLAGTGSILLATAETGKILRAGGLGYQVGDEGGGYWLGKSAIVTMISEEKSSDRFAEAFRGSLLKVFGCGGIEEAIEKVSIGNNAVPLVASLAPTVLALAEGGNPQAQHIASQGARHLAELLEELGNEATSSVEREVVGVAGSLLLHSEFYRTMIARNAPWREVEWKLLRFPPVFGGLAEAYPSLNPEAAWKGSRVHA